MLSLKQTSLDAGQTLAICADAWVAIDRLVSSRISMRLKGEDVPSATTLAARILLLMFACYVVEIKYTLPANDNIEHRNRLIAKYVRGPAAI